MKYSCVIYEALSDPDKFFINKYLKQGIPVYIVEPFHAYHHRKNQPFFPSAHPSYVKKLIEKDNINFISSESLNAREITLWAADKAVEVIESVYPTYREENTELFNYVLDTLQSSKAEDIFKINLCDRLAQFYSVNILIHRIEKLLSPSNALFFPDINVRTYSYLKGLLVKSGQDIFKHPNIRFSRSSYVSGFLGNIKKNLIAVSKLSAQTLVSGILGSSASIEKKEKKMYSYGITVVAPNRQLRSNQRGPDFIIDNDKIKAGDVVYLPTVDLTIDQKNKLERLGSEIYYPPKAGRFFSNFTEWRRLLRLSMKKPIFQNPDAVNDASIALLNYFRWLDVLKSISIKHFITHCDFGIKQVPRNIALNQARVQTWYFTDSMNFGINFKEEGKNRGMHHPFWTYLRYDHFVTWNDFLSQYFNEHPGSFNQVHVIGCLWSGHIKEKGAARILINKIQLKHLNDTFIIAAFDSSFSRNGITSYSEGLAFAEDLLKLANECSDVRIFLKEKKDRAIHNTNDPVLGPELLNVYNKMDSHERITTCSNETDASELMSIAHMTVSFPFTSTTFEALSANKPAVWHDPLGYYNNSPYGMAGGVTTHSYDELKTKVLEIKTAGPGEYRTTELRDSSLMDPFQDGMALERFRELLVASC